MYYPAVFEPDGEGWTVSFPDIPEALTSGASKEEAMEMAQDALITAMEFYFEDRREIPLPSEVMEGMEAIELPSSVTAKVLLLNEMVRQRVRPSELARKLGTSAQDVNRLTQLNHATKIDGIAAALGALGKRLEIRLA